jgi:hypothetical protein
MNFFDRIHETQIARMPVSAIFPVAGAAGRPSPAALHLAAQRRIARAAVMEVLG